MPTRKMKIGAQKCVIQRVMNSANLPASRTLNPPTEKKSRVWSSAMTIMTRPRKRSIEVRRGLGCGIAAEGATRAGLPGEACAGVSNSRVKAHSFQKLHRIARVRELHRVW